MGEFKVPKRIKKTKKYKNNSQTSNTIIYVVSIGLAIITSFYIYLMSLPPIKNLDEFKPNIVTKFYSYDGEVIKTFTAFTFSKVTLEQIPDNVKNAIISTEDKN